MHSATFQLKKRNKTIINKNKDESNQENENNYFYEEKERNEDNCLKDDITTIHLIMANLSETGKYYDNFPITFLRDQMTSCTNLQPFDVIEDIKSKFSLISSELLDNIEVSKEKIEVIDDESDDRNINKIIRLSKDIFTNLPHNNNGNEKYSLNKYQLILKKCLVDELGFSNFSESAYEPKFRYYIQNSKLYNKIEVPGIKEDETEYEVQIIGENYQFKFSGVKEIEKTPKNDEKEKYISNIIEGPFKLVFQLKFSDFPLVDKYKPQFEYVDGIMTAIFELKTEKVSNKKVVFKKK